MSVTSQTRSKSAWMTDDNGNLTAENETVRRHSYDVNMNWNTMPQSFLARSDLLPNLVSGAPQQQRREEQQQQQPPFVEASKLSWTQDGTFLASRSSNNQSGYSQLYEYIQHPMSAPSVQESPYTSGTFPSMAYYGSSQQHYQGPFYDPYHQESAVKRNQSDQETPYMAQYSPHPRQQAPQPIAMLMQPDPFYNSPRIGDVHTPATGSAAGTTLQSQAVRQSAARGTKRRRNKADDEDEYVIDPGDPDFPDMAAADVEAARRDPEARPRKQKLRFPDDQYTPRWVRYNGQAKEGLCDTCKPGKWLQLKNSAYWYHKQFFHGISSVSGKEFIQPLEKRWIDQDVMEGLCHQCGQWVPVTNNKRKNSVLWYRHAHKVQNTILSRSKIAANHFNNHTSLNSATYITNPKVTRPPKDDE